MAWQFVAAGTVATGASPSPGIPAGYAAGDLFIFIHSSSASSGANNPSGYTNLVRNTAASPFFAVWWKVAGASESAVSITNSNTATKAVVLAYRYIDTASIDATGTLTTGTTTSVTPTAVTTTKANDLVLNLYGGGVTSTSTGTWSGGSTNKRVTSGSSTTLCAIYATDLLQAATGSSTTFAGTLSRASTGTQGVALAFRSATHGNTGTLTGQGAAVAGTAQHNIPHSTSGTLTGSGAAVVGSADRTAGVVDHATTGALVGSGAAVTGSAARTREHATSGTLTGQGAAVSGSSVHNIPHPTSGALVGQGSAVSGSSARFRAFATSGALVGQGATVTGDASRSAGPVTHDTSGSLTGQGSAVAGSSNRFRAMASSGALVGSGATVEGTANRAAAPVSHATSGALVGQGAEVVGSALRYRQLSTSGALTGQGAALSGVAARTRQHETTGDLIGQGSAIVGAADRLHEVKTHDTSGALVGSGAVVTGEARNGLAVPTGGADPSEQRKARQAVENARRKIEAGRKRKLKEQIEAIQAAASSSPNEPVAQTVEPVAPVIEPVQVKPEPVVNESFTTAPIAPVKYALPKSLNDLIAQAQADANDVYQSIQAEAYKSDDATNSLLISEQISRNDDDDALALIMILAEID